MSYPQQPRPRPRRPERTPSTNFSIPIPPGAPAAAGTPPLAYGSPRMPFSPEPPRPGTGSSSRSFPRPGTSSRPGTASPSSRPDFRSGPASPSRPDYRPGTSSSSRPGTASSSRGAPQPHPLSPNHARVAPADAAVAPSPLKQATIPSDLQDVPLHAADPPPVRQANRPPTLPPPPASLPATTHSRFSDVSDADRAAAGGFFKKRRARGNSRGASGSTPSLSVTASWPTLAQWTMLPLVLLLSGAVAVLMGHSLSLYGGLKIAGTVDYTTDTHPVWPAGLDLFPVWLALAVAFASFCATVIVWGFSLRRRFMKPVKGLAGWRLGLGAFFVGAWVAAIVVFKLFESGDGGGGFMGGDTLGKWACDHKGDDVIGGFEIARVCTEQSAGFALAIVAAVLEVGLIVCFAMRLNEAKDDGDAPVPLSEKNLGKSRA